MSIKLIATDLDGTLFGSKGMIPGDNIVAVAQAMAAGIPVVPCSGRCPVDLSYVLRQLGQDTPMIAFNGAVITLPGQKEPVYRQPMPRQLLESVAEVCLKHDAFTNICTVGTRYVIPASHHLERALAQQKSMGLHGVKVVLIDRFDEITEDEKQSCLKILTSIKDEKRMAALRKDIEALPMDMTTSASWWDNVEIMAPGVNKGQGILRLCQILSISPDEVMVLGDAENDLPMFRVAGFPVAMGNGMDCVKKLAKAVTKDNDEAGVAYAIRKYALGQDF